jgi:hypothetical protein
VKLTTTTTKTPKKSMWRDEQTKTNKQETEQTDRQTNKQTKIPGSGTIEFQSYFKFFYYSSNILSWCLYLSRSSVIILPGSWVVFDLFSFVFQTQLLGQLSWVWQFKFVCCPEVPESVL